MECISYNKVGGKQKLTLGKAFQTSLPGGEVVISSTYVGMNNKKNMVWQGTVLASGRPMHLNRLKLLIPYP